MLVATCKIKGTGHLIFSRRVDEPKLKGEDHDAYERRIWKHKAHATDDGNVYVPAIAFKRALDSTASTLKRKVKGKGQSTYTKVFVTGVACGDDAALGVTLDDLRPVTILCSAQGKKGGQGGTQVPRVFPQLSKWATTIDFYILSDELPRDVFEEHLKAAGILNGVGSFRAQNGGMAGRFTVESVTWKEMA